MDQEEDYNQAIYPKTIVDILEASWIKGHLIGEFWQLPAEEEK